MKDLDKAFTDLESAIESVVTEMEQVAKKVMQENPEISYIYDCQGASVVKLENGDVKDWYDFPELAYVLDKWTEHFQYDSGVWLDRKDIA